MDEYPTVKGWKPFKSIASDIAEKEKKLKKEKEKENYKNKNGECEGLEVPKDFKTPSFTQADNPHKRLFAQSEFKVLFPSNLATYLKEAFSVAQKALSEHFINAQLILNDGEMIVSTTRKTFDPVMILKAQLLISLLARYVPVEETITVLEDGIEGDIINVGHRNHDTFINRKKRISEPSIIELIKEILDCKVFISGKTVCAIGSYKNLDKVREIVLDCFDNNIHPIYKLKRLQVINRLKSMPEMEGKDWTDLLPPIPKKKNVKRAKPLKINVKKEYELFPPAPVESQIDKDLASGVFGLKYEKKKGKKYFSLIDKEKTKEEEKQKKKEELKSDLKKESSTAEEESKTVIKTEDEVKPKKKDKHKSDSKKENIESETVDKNVVATKSSKKRKCSDEDGDRMSKKAKKAA